MALHAVSDDTIGLVSLISVTGRGHAFEVGPLLFCAPTEADSTAWVAHLKTERAIHAKRFEALNDAGGGGGGAGVGGGAGGGGDGAANAGEVDGLAFRVVSYNVNFALCQIGTRDTEERSICDALAAANADIVLLQETTPDW